MNASRKDKSAFHFFRPDHPPKDARVVRSGEITHKLFRGRRKGSPLVPYPGGLYDPCLFGCPRYRASVCILDCDGAICRKDGNDAYPQGIYLDLEALYLHPLFVKGKGLRFLAKRSGLPFDVLQSLTRYQERNGASLIDLLPDVLYPYALRYLYIPPSAVRPPSPDGIPPLLTRYYQELLCALRASSALSQQLPMPGSKILAHACVQHALNRLFWGEGGLMGALIGKMGIFRRHLAGKRVKWSGRAVIVPDPSLPLDACRIPSYILGPMFAPLLSQSLPGKSQREIIVGLAAPSPPEPLMRALRAVADQHRVLLNRTPTLHRLNMAAMRIVAGDGFSIGINPGICASFNADFDGDTMSVWAMHIALSRHVERLSPVYNLQRPADGRPIPVAQKDFLFGLIYATQSNGGASGDEEAEIDWQRAIADPRTVVNLAYRLPLANKASVVLAPSESCFVLRRAQNANANDPLFVISKQEGGCLQTTLGRAIVSLAAFNGRLLLDAEFSQDVLTFILAKLKNINKTVGAVFNAVDVINGLFKVGAWACAKSGVSFGVDDLIPPPDVAHAISNAADKVRRAVRRGLLPIEEGSDLFARECKRIAGRFAEQSVAASDAGRIALEKAMYPNLQYGLLCATFDYPRRDLRFDLFAATQGD